MFCEEIISFFSIHSRFFYTQIPRLTKTCNKHVPSNGSKRFKVEDDSLPFELDPDFPDTGKYTLRRGWKLHMYISQLPCNSKDFNNQNPSFIIIIMWIIMRVWLWLNVLCGGICRRGCFTEFFVLFFRLCVAGGK